MTRTQIKKDSSKHYNQLKKQVKKTVLADCEALHDFRVAYKKLRAFLRLVQQKKTAAIKVTKKIKTAYQTAGTIRNLQLQCDRLLEDAKKGNEQPMAYANLVGKRIDKLTNTLSKTLSKKVLAKCEKATGHLLPKQLSIKRLVAFAKQKWKAIYLIITSGELADTDLHMLRKLLKDIFYNVHFYEDAKLDIFSMSFTKAKEKIYYEGLLGDLGSFQDMVVCVELFNTFNTKYLNEFNLEQIDRIRNEWIEEKLVMKQQLIIKLKGNIA